ncbi:YfcE family phosphodiesterase [Wansuia hejianensis]|uniref:Phosphoesterase n=1 Tax=Wansuia hejianensis TaxID=2763667 RepID=A0A926F0T8_9FIRM|nr:metallophosphoesterase [Wansuia hejianensis]MBC8589795.1 metallophosphoesterase [Wansuia hejianensis]
MNILVVSDTHGRNQEVIEHIAQREKVDLLFHLGDYVEDGEEISRTLEIPSVIVNGNGDFLSKYKDDELIEIMGKKIFLTHGHSYNVRFTIDNIYYKAAELGASVALFGHTHIPINIKEENIIIMNPGSPSFPRGSSWKKTYGIINIDEDSKNIETKIIEMD